MYEISRIWEEQTRSWSGRLVVGCIDCNWLPDRIFVVLKVDPDPVEDGVRVRVLCSRHDCEKGRIDAVSITVQRAADLDQRLFGGCSY